MSAKMRVFLLAALIALLLAPALAAAQLDYPLLRLLRAVPNTQANREYLVFGDIAAWHESWGIPRVDNLDELNALDPQPHAYWMNILGRQTLDAPPLGLQYLMLNDQRPFYGFDYFNVDRFINAGMPPSEVTVIDHNVPSDQIEQALTASGYTVSEIALKDGSTIPLYGILEDNEMALGTNVPRVGMTGTLNRIAVLQGQLVIGRATDSVVSVLRAMHGEGASLADVAEYPAAVKALYDPSLADTGQLVGAILIYGTVPGADEPPLSPDATPQPQAGTLPPYTLTVFATSHAEGASYLTLGVVFLPGADASAAADVLAERLRSYVSLRTHNTLEDFWTFDRATGIEVDGRPVALVTMRVDDPVTEPGAQQINAAVFSWAPMIFSRDLGFLSLGQPAE